MSSLALIAIPETAALQCAKPDTIPQIPIARDAPAYAKHCNIVVRVPPRTPQFTRIRKPTIKP